MFPHFMRIGTITKAYTYAEVSTVHTGCEAWMKIVRKEDRNGTKNRKRAESVCGRVCAHKTSAWR